MVKVSFFCTIDSSWGHLGQFESTLLQEGDGDLHAVVGGTFQQQSQHLQAQDLMGLRGYQSSQLEINNNQTFSLDQNQDLPHSG